MSGFGVLWFDPMVSLVESSGASGRSGGTGLAGPWTGERVHEQKSNSAHLRAVCCS